MLIDRKQLIKKIHKDLRVKTKAELALEIGIPAMTLGRLIREKENGTAYSMGSIETWELIARYYCKNNQGVCA